MSEDAEHPAGIMVRLPDGGTAYFHPHPGFNRVEYEYEDNTMVIYMVDAEGQRTWTAMFPGATKIIRGPVSGFARRIERGGW